MRTITGGSCFTDAQIHKARRLERLARPSCLELLNVRRSAETDLAPGPTTCRSGDRRSDFEQEHTQHYQVFPLASHTAHSVDHISTRFKANSIHFAPICGHYTKLYHSNKTSKRPAVLRQFMRDFHAYTGPHAQSNRNPHDTERRIVLAHIFPAHPEIVQFSIHEPQSSYWQRPKLKHHSPCSTHLSHDPSHWLYCVVVSVNAIGSRVRVEVDVTVRPQVAPFSAERSLGDQRPAAF